MGFMGNYKARQQMLGEVPTYCIKCGRQITIKMTGSDGSYTKLCGCGCDIYKAHPTTENAVGEYFTRLFITNKQYDKDYKNKNGFEKKGFKKINGKWCK